MQQNMPFTLMKNININIIAMKNLLRSISSYKRKSLERCTRARDSKFAKQFRLNREPGQVNNGDAGSEQGFSCLFGVELPFPSQCKGSRAAHLRPED